MKRPILLGVFGSAIYGLIFRLVFEEFEIYNLAGFTFFILVPIAIGVAAILLSRNAFHSGLSNARAIVYGGGVSFLGVLVFFAASIATGIEDLLCVLIFSFPFGLPACAAGALTAFNLRNRDDNIPRAFLLLPLLAGPLEEQLPVAVQRQTVEQSIHIEASRESIWAILEEVPEIQEQEYKPGFYNYIGVPRPRFSQLEDRAGAEYRVGYFTGGLELVESVVEKDSLSYLAFAIHLDKSKLRDLPTDNHVLKSELFDFETIAYTIIPEETGCTLKLSCNYTISSRVNGYGNFWATRVIGDFESRLLAALKVKLENKIVGYE